MVCKELMPPSHDLWETQDFKVRHPKHLLAPAALAECCRLPAKSEPGIKPFTTTGPPVSLECWSPGNRRHNSCDGLAEAKSIAGLQQLLNKAHHHIHHYYYYYSSCCCCCYCYCYCYCYYHYYYYYYCYYHYYYYYYSYYHYYYYYYFCTTPVGTLLLREGMGLELALRSLLLRGLL